MAKRPLPRPLATWAPIPEMPETFSSRRTSVLSVTKEALAMVLVTLSQVRQYCWHSSSSVGSELCMRGVPISLLVELLTGPYPLCMK